MKWYLSILLFAYLTSQSQNLSTDSSRFALGKKRSSTEILTNGFIDVQNTGQMNASARLIKIHIGEPNKFSIPVSMYSGVTGNGFSNSAKPNEQMIVNLVNPLSGIFNISIDGSQQIPRKNSKLTKVVFLYQAGQRFLSFTDISTFQSTTFNNLFFNSGILFQTSAWEKSKTENIGILQISSRILNIQSNKIIQDYLSLTSRGSSVWAHGLTFGLEIDKLISFRCSIYKYLSRSTLISYKPIYQISMNYELK
jgi:hypothetical protein